MNKIMKDSIKTLKSSLRKEMKKKLLSLPQEELNKQSEIVLNKLFALPVFVKSLRVSVYLSTNAEISTEPIVRKVLGLGKTCYVPRYDSNIMQMVKLNSLEDYNTLPVTKWNIKQPSLNEDREEALETGGLDLIIVPGVAFTKDGNRLGHGKGFYDSYLKKCNEMQQKPVTIALAFTEQIVDDIPVHEHDIKINLVLSP